MIFVRSWLVKNDCYFCKKIFLEKIEKNNLFSKGQFILNYYLIKNKIDKLQAKYNEYDKASNDTIPLFTGLREQKIAEYSPKTFAKDS